MATVTEPTPSTSKEGRGSSEEQVRDEVPLLPGATSMSAEEQDTIRQLRMEQARLTQARLTQARLTHDLAARLEAVENKTIG